MHFTKVQISELMRKHAEKENGLHDLIDRVSNSVSETLSITFKGYAINLSKMLINTDFTVSCG